MEIAAEHERYVTSLINAIYHEAHQDKDYRTMKFLDWFIDEQMEEEEAADRMIGLKGETQKCPYCGTFHTF